MPWDDDMDFMMCHENVATVTIALANVVSRSAKKPSLFFNSLCKRLDYRSEFDLSGSSNTLVC